MSSETITVSAGHGSGESQVRIRSSIGMAGSLSPRHHTTNVRCPSIAQGGLRNVIEGRAFEDDDLDLTPTGSFRTRRSRCGDLAIRLD